MEHTGSQSQYHLLFPNIKFGLNNKEHYYQFKGIEYIEPGSLVRTGTEFTNYSKYVYFT